MKLVKWLLVFPTAMQLWSPAVLARAVQWHWSIDVRATAESAPTVFRGRVVGLQLDGEVSEFRLDALAHFEPDRWYRGTRPKEVWVRFSWNALRPLNHGCENLQLGSRWLVFAKEAGNHLELLDDCNRVLPVSEHLGPVVSGSYLSQMEADFAAGRNDASVRKRVWSLWWLGGLHSSSSRQLLEAWARGSGGIEKKWALHALSEGTGRDVWRRTDDDIGLCENWAAPDLDGADALEEDVREAKTEWGLGCTMRALGEEKALSAFVASHLEDDRPSVRWDAIASMHDSTGAAACVPSESLRAAWKCAAWWKQHRREFPYNLVK